MMAKLLRQRYWVVLAVFVLVLVGTAPDAAATRRILVVGDSWAQWPVDMGSFQTVLNHNFGTNTYRIEGTYTALGGTTAASWASNAVPSEDTFPSPPGHTNMGSLDRITWSLNNWPTIDIIHLSISGNDMWSWRASWSAAQAQALYDSIQANVETVINWIRTNHPHVKVLIAGYDYLNITETCTYGMTEFDWLSAALSNELGLTPGDFNQNRNNNRIINQFFAGFGPRQIAIAQATPRVDFIQNFGNIQWRAGYRNSAGWMFGEQQVPFPGIAPDYSPLPGGDVNWGTPPWQMNDIGGGKRDPIHLSNGGYRLLFDNCVMQYYAAWLTDSTPPVVQSIMRVHPSPTELDEVAFTVTFSEGVRGVDASDFQLTGDAAVGASIVSVTGAQDTASRTVTVDISGAANGLLRLDFIDNGSVFDKAWNAIGGEGTGNGNYTSGQTYVVDKGDPVPVVTPDIPEPTLLSSVPFTVTFNKAVTGFTATDIVLNVLGGTGTAQVTNFAGSGAVYTFNLLVTRNETIGVAISIPAGVAVDASNRPNLAGQYSDGDDDVYTFEYVSGPGEPGDLYISNGTLGDLTVASGASITINTGSTPPTLQVNGEPVVEGNAQSVDGGNVAKFNFANVSVASGVSISVSGNRPLALVASGDMTWDSVLDVSGVVPGRAGSGTGGSGGSGGSGGPGGSGATSGGGGGGAAGGGRGSPNPTTNYGNGLGYGETGSGRNAGGGGGSGTIGGGGGQGGLGQVGSEGFGGMGAAGTSGARGPSGAAASQANSGSAGSGGGGGGSGGPWRYGNEGQPPQAGHGGGGNAGGNATAGATGGHGGTGGIGGNAQFTALADSLLLAAGHGGGGGGGGGGGAGGQGGGKGGGGSSGGGGGGGGLAWTTYIAQCGTPVNGTGGAGGTGGVGGGGGNGGQGGTALTGASGGDGGGGGGAAVLAARGLLAFGGAVDISSGAPASGGEQRAAQAGNAGSDPGNNGSGGAGGNNGGTGYWWLDFWGCHINYVNGGWGGNGGTGGRGGIGGTGGPSGASGAGGAGGLGTPGMVKLHGSVVLAGDGTVICDNHTPSTDNSLRGRATVISNLKTPDAPDFTDDFLLGTTTNNSWLRSSAPYAVDVQIPILPQLDGGLATGGYVTPGFWNEAQFAAAHSGTPLLEIAELRATDSPFLDFDQIFVVNNDTEVIDGVVVSVAGYAPYLLGDLPSGAVWTTTVPAGTNVVVSAALSVEIAEDALYTYIGEPLTLNAVTDGGIEPLTWRWMRNGDTVQDGFAESYTVASATVDDAGIYTVEVTDVLSQQAVSPQGVAVAIAAPVQVTQAPQPAVVPVGGSHVFTVTATGGHGTRSYDWRKDGVSLGAPDQPYLTLSPIVAESEGDYDVVVTDMLGVAPNGLVASPVPAAFLEVSYPLTVTGPADVVVYSDDAEAVFEVEVSGGVPPYNYVWRHNGADLPPEEQAGGPVLTLSAPLEGLGGTYRCVVTDSSAPPDSEPSETARLDIYPRLQITQQPQGGDFYRDSTAILQVTVTGGAPSLVYVWRKDGEPLPLEQQPQGNVLSLPNMQFEAAGVYDVVVYDGHTDEVTSDTAVITVLPPPPVEIVSPPEGATVKVGGAHIFTVETSGGDGTLAYEWWFDDGTSGAVTVGGNQPYLVVNDVTMADAGSYWVLITDAVGTLDSSAEHGFANLAVVDEALINIVSHPQGAVIDAGASHTFTVTAAGGAGTLAYTWYVDYGVGHQPLQIGGNTPQLTVSNATKADTGVYWVEVHDAYESVDSDTAELYVALTITGQPQGGTVPLGGALTLSVAADGGAGPLNYQWKLERDEKSPINVGGNAPAYVITDAALEDAGTYWVEVSDNDTSVMSAPADVEVLQEAQVPSASWVGIAVLALVLATAAVRLAPRCLLHRNDS